MWWRNNEKNTIIPPWPIDVQELLHAVQRRLADVLKMGKKYCYFPPRRFPGKSKLIFYERNRRVTGGGNIFCQQKGGLRERERRGHHLIFTTPAKSTKSRRRKPDTEFRRFFTVTNLATTNNSVLRL